MEEDIPEKLVDDLDEDENLTQGTGPIAEEIKLESSPTQSMDINECIPLEQCDLSLKLANRNIDSKPLHQEYYEEIPEQMEMINEEDDEEGGENSRIITPEKKKNSITHKQYFSPEIRKTLPPLQEKGEKIWMREENIYSREAKRCSDT